MAINTNNIAPTLIANFNPSVVPLDIASRALVPILSFEMIKFSLICSVSGTKIFAATIAAGAEIIDAVSRCFAKKACCSGSSPPRKPT